MKTTLQLLLTLAVAGLLVSCGKSGSSSQMQAPDPATQPEAHAALFQRTSDRVKSLIESKDFKGAQAALDMLKGFKLTPEQKKIVDQFQAQIPK